MPQIEVSEQELQKVDELVKNGVFQSRESAIKGILENLSELSLEEIKGMEKAKKSADMYSIIFCGDVIPLTPTKTFINGKELYKVPLKIASTDSIFGYVFVNAQTMEVDVDLSTSWESLHNMSNEQLEETKKIQTVADNYCENHLENMIAGVPRKVTIEDKKHFEVLVKRREEDKTYIYGGLFIDAETLAVEAMIHKYKERVHEIDEMIRHVSTVL